jgi:glycosyltransferase involved in cell wall biosynthesis
MRKKGMNIIVTTGGDIPSKFAHSFNVMKMAQGFYNLGNNVKVVVPLSFPLLIRKIKIKDIYSFYGIDKDIRIKYIPVLSLKTLKQSNDFTKFDLSVADYCKRQNVDLAYSRSYRIPYLCVKKGVPSIIETHTTNYGNSDLKKIYEVSDNPNFKGLVTISKDIKKEHIKRGISEEKILVLEDGVDIERFDINNDKYLWRKKLKLPANMNLVVYCGHLYEEKGIEHILLTASKLSKKNVLFVLVGGFAKDISRWKKLCKTKFICNVSFKGFVNNLEIPRYLKAADVLIMPYNTTTDFNIMDINTTSPMKLFEYMASKRPIVSTNIPTISKIIEHNKSGLLAEANNIEQLSSYVVELIEDSEKSKKLASKAFEDVKKYTWVNRCRKILKLI